MFAILAAIAAAGLYFLGLVVWLALVFVAVFVFTATKEAARAAHGRASHKKTPRPSGLGVGEK